jgi:RimJ/RimL family protein N-acetyltransferase
MTAEIQPVLTTPRLRLRPFAPADATAVQLLAGDREIASTTLEIPHPYPDDAAAAWIASHAEQFAQGTSVHFAITLADNGQLVGTMSLMGISRRHLHAELGYWIGRPHWGHGYATEAGQAILRYAFEDLNLNRVHCHHFVRNPASGRVMQKLGMLNEGLQRQHVRKGDQYEDIEMYGILRTDWHDASAS